MIKHMARPKLTWQAAVMLGVALGFSACGPKPQGVQPGDEEATPEAQTVQATSAPETLPGTESEMTQEQAANPVESSSTNVTDVNESTEDEGDTLTAEPTKAEAALIKGTELLHRGEYAKAFEQLMMSATLDSENEEVFFNLGFVLARMDREQDAIKAYLRTIQLSPRYGEAHNNLGNLLLKRKVFDKAVVHFQLALAIHPENAATHNNLGTALSQQGKVNEALPHFVKATQLDKLYIQAWCNLGNAFRVMERVEDATQAFQNALRIDPNFRPALSGMQRLEEQPAE